MTANEAMVRVLVAASAGSVPREAGTQMFVGAQTSIGTIGGGALEFDAIRIARDVLTDGAPRHEVLALGPALGQCCGGSVTLVWERFDVNSRPEELSNLRRLSGTAQSPEKIARRAAILQAGANPILEDGWIAEASPLEKAPLWIWGAGHVGRALVDIIAPLPDWAISWVDTSAQRFPNDIPQDVTQLVAADPVRLVQYAPRNAEHLILTYSHQIDLALCDAIIGHGFGAAGLIGSATKWTRFRKRLGEMGHSGASIARVACPIGDPKLGKHPQAIALGVAASLLARDNTLATLKGETG